MCRFGFFLWQVLLLNKNFVEEEKSLSDWIFLFQIEFFWSINVIIKPVLVSIFYEFKANLFFFFFFFLLLDFCSQKIQKSLTNEKTSLSFSVSCPSSFIWMWMDSSFDILSSDDQAASILDLIPSFVVELICISSSGNGCDLSNSFNKQCA